MDISHNDTHLFITISDLEWEDIFFLNDGEYVDIFTDDLNMDIFFPNWKSYVNSKDVLPTLNYDDAARFRFLNIHLEDSIKDRSGEGTYKIVDYCFVPAIDEDSEPMKVNIDDNMDQMIMITVYFEKIQ